MRYTLSLPLTANVTPDVIPLSFQIVALCASDPTCLIVDTSGNVSLRRISFGPHELMIMIQLAIHEKPPPVEGKHNPVHAIGSLTDLGGLHFGANRHGTLAPHFPQLSPKYLTSQSNPSRTVMPLNKDTPA